LEDFEMTLYWTPLGQMVRRRMVNQAMQEANMNVEQTTTVVFPVDVKAEQDAYEITALLPGVNSEDLDIQVENETVSIRGELKLDRPEDQSFLLRERPSGKFSRVLNLPTTLDPEHAEARVENGILTLRVPKAETARPRIIKVKTSSN
jgi:HSP20 family protein